ncbi:MAG TPA: hypothetical protein DC054_21075 [Blastocatellia bacterium]|nr:hypothetical protein [Blastocatellia bacterium]
MQTSIEALIEAAKHLTPEDREKLVRALRQQSESVHDHSITEMRGLGRDLWQGVDAQDYINSERDSWEN